jgi:formiminotetrahydrofolate cyclodeaminase
MAGAVIAASAAQAVALGLACLQLSLAHQPAHTRQITAQLEQLSNIKTSLVEWCDQDAVAIAKFVALRKAGDELTGQHLLCDAPAQISRSAVEAATLLQMFRPWVSERVRDDLEMSLTLLAGAAQAAMLLLDSNLRLWPDEALLEKYEPIRADLEIQIKHLTPVARIRR